MPTTPNQPIQYYNRYTQQIETEPIYAEPYLRWTYQTTLGRLTLHLLIKRRLFTTLYAWKMNQPSSKPLIQPLIQKYNINPNEQTKPTHQYQTFNQYFTRKLKPHTRPINPNPNTLTFPADGRHIAIPNLTHTTTLYTKQQQLNLQQLLQNPQLTQQYQNGTAILTRLNPTDCHRFHFPANGTPNTPKTIPGPLHSVNPIALRRTLNYLTQNKRTITQLHTTNTGTITTIEIGATNIGTIQQTHKPNQPVTKGQEKGYFAFGGSAILTLLQPNQITLPQDLLTHSQNQLETYAKMGDTMAYTKNHN